MYIKLEWTDEIGDIEEKEFWSWNECFSFVAEILVRINNESNKN